ncbi:MAG: lamin tail domain-containing protein [Roseibacillus sp.]
MPIRYTNRAAIFAALLLILSPEPLQAQSVLFIGGSSTASSGADGSVMAYLETRYGAANVSYLGANASSAGDEAGFDVLIISSTVSSNSVRGKFHDSAVPVLNWESVITDNSQAGEFEVTTRLNESETDHSIRITTAHPITAGFTVGQVVQLVSGSGSVFWSVMPEASGVVHLAEDDDSTTNKFISIVEQGGTLMGGGAAPARRVMFGLKGDTFSSLTVDGETLFGQAVDWAAAGSVTPDPPSVINVGASNVGATEATIGGEVTDTGGVAPAVTLYWGDNDGGSTVGGWDHSINFGAQSGSFSGGISSLNPGTTYYFRSFASNAGGDDWALSSSSFTTDVLPNPPFIVNSAASGITFTDADVNGIVIGTGGEVPNVTIYFGDNNGGTVVGNWDDSVAVGSQGAGFSNSLFGLTPDTTYFFRAFAQNSGGASWAPNSATFSTLAYSAPTVATAPAGNVTGTAAQLSGTVTSTGGEAPTVSLFWGDNDGGTDPLAWDQEADLGQQSADFSTTVSGLSPLTTYYVRAFAQNSGGSAWGTTIPFMTLESSHLIISEFMAANDGGTSNNPNSWWPIANQVAGSTEDWIEIQNTGSSPLDLGGWHLTDNAGNPAQWTFPPSTNIDGGDFLVVYASGNNSPDANGNLHANFALAANGEYLALIGPSGFVASEFGPGGSAYPPQDDDLSYGLHPNSGTSVYFTSPTPGAPNDPGGIARVADTKFSPDRGYYSTAIEVTISTATPGATIYYTTDGTPPLTSGGTPAAGSRLYSGPIAINRTTPLRAAARQAGLQSSNIDTHTYILLDTENANSTGVDPAGLNTPFLRQVQPSGWGNLASGDYNMDVTVTRSSGASTGHRRLTVSQAMLKGMRDIPTISIAMDRNDFAGGNGIYSNPGSRGFAWERDCSAEFIPFLGDTRKDWGENCGLRVQGGASRNTGKSPKHSLSFRFRAEYGAGKLRENLFPDGPVSEFNVIVLRAGYNNSWIHSNSGQRRRGSMIRDQWAREAMLDMGHPDAGRGFMVHLFINGLYWGVHNLCERQDAAHYAAYNGGDEDTLDARNGSDFIDGNSNAWNTMKSVVAARNWTRIQQVLDVDTYIDYQIVNRYGGNGDLKSNGNWRAAGGGPRRMAWKLYSWDGERILEGQTSTTQPLDPMGVRSYLDSMSEYKLRFGDRLQKHFFNGGAMTPDACMARWMKFATPLDRAIIAESARWGDHRRNPEYTRNGEWLTERNRLNNSYFPVRSNNVLARYESQGFYPSIDAPTFRIGNSPQHGGVIASGGFLRILGTGTIYYTLDGSDPRLQGGAINPSATAITSGAAVSLPASGLVRVRARSGSVWSALDEATFYLEPLATPGDLHVEEVNYHPAPASALEKVAAAALPTPKLLTNADLFEFIEICNFSADAVNLDGVKFDAGIDFTFGNTVLGPGAYAVVVKDPEAFAIRYPGVPIAGTFTGNLDNDGENIALIVGGGDIVQEFTYNDASDWPSRSDGVGSSLEVSDPAGDYNEPVTWRASGEYNGSPGVAGNGPDGRIVINEVLTHTDLPTVDRIELYNTTGGEIDVSGWVLSDSARQFRSFAIEGVTRIGGGAYLTLDESDFNAPQWFAIGAYAGTVAASPTTLSSLAPHGLVTGNLATISGYGGVGAYNGSFEVTVIDASTFTIETAFLDNDGTRGAWTPGRPFALNGGHGDEVWLLETDALGNPIKFVDYVDFEGAFEGESLGRWPNGAGSETLVSTVANTLGFQNVGPQVGPVVISELNYQPVGGVEEQLEFVEICNTGAATENLDRWRMRGGADFDFSSTHELAPGDTLVVVAFDPQADPAAAIAFRTAYGIDGSILLVGPFSDGPLRNDKGSVRLQRPDQPPFGEPGFYPAVTEDVVDYLSVAPWPVSAAGGGDSLRRSNLFGYGSFASSWIGAPANPGAKALDYAGWRDGFFGPGAPVGSAALDDFDLDGILNLFEFGLGLNPLVFDNQPLIPIEVEGGELSLRYAKNTLLSGIIYYVEVSADLLNWNPIPDVLESTNGYLEMRRASVTMTPNPQLFLRLVVEEQ